VNGGSSVGVTVGVSVFVGRGMLVGVAICCGEQAENSIRNRTIENGLNLFILNPESHYLEVIEN
jgi:hypothetical protein